MQLSPTAASHPKEPSSFLGSRESKIQNLKSRITALLIALLAPAYGAADTAIVVGVEKYQIPEIRELKGCEGDAKSVGQALKNLGYNVTLVLGKDATHAGVLKALEDASKKVKPNENFVFYFAGHGCRNPVGILPYDAQKLGNFITPTELRTAVLKVNSATRSVLLDSCFSGAMARSKGLADKFRARVYEPRSGIVIEDDEPAAGLETTNPFASDSRISYFTASQFNEPALEKEDEGGSHGVFTLCLLPHLKAPLAPWGAVNMDVRKTMMAMLDKTGDQQFPTLAPPSISSLRMFSTEKVEVAPPKGLLDLYALDKVSDKDFKLTASPAKTAMQAGERLALDFNFSQPGFLVLLGNLGGKYYVAFPSGGSFDASDAEVGTSFHLPREGKDLAFDDFGEDHIQCLFFTDKERAQAVLDSMRDLSNGASLTQFAGGKLDSSKGSGDVYTRRMSFAVGRSLIGGKPAKDLGKLVQRVSKAEDPREKWMAAAIKSEFLDPNPSTEHAQSRMLMLTNLAIQDPASIYEPASGIKLAPETAALMRQKPKGQDLVRFNRWVLEDAFPEHFEKNMDGGKRK